MIDGEIKDRLSSGFSKFFPMSATKVEFSDVLLSLDL